MGGSNVDVVDDSSHSLLTTTRIPTTYGINNNNLRELEQNSRDSGDENRYYNNQYNNDENGDNDDDGNVLTRFGDRVMSDMSTMWDTAPSEWVTEYWEVFAGLAALGFFLLSLHCCMAYDLCCGHNDGKLGEAHSGGRPVMTAQQNQQKLTEKDTINAQQSNTDMKSLYQPPNALDPRSIASREDEENDGIMKEEAALPTSQLVEKTGTPASTPTSYSTKTKQIKRLVQETVTVWSEFLGLSSPYDSDYHRQALLRRRKRRSTAAQLAVRSSTTDDGTSTASTHMSSVLRDDKNDKYDNNQEQSHSNYVDVDEVVPSSQRSQLV